MPYPQGRAAPVSASLALGGDFYMNQGWIKLYRRIADNWIWQSKPFSYGQAWIDLLLLANHQDSYLWVRGIQLPVKRGQVGWSEAKLAQKWGWGRTAVRTFIKRLKTEQQIEQQKNYTTSLITILNYEEYQGIEQQIDQQPNSSRTAAEH